jgi:O-antigen/teichoic acid export membrane protein
MALKALAKQTALYGLSTMVGRLLNYLLVPWYSRLFAPEAYGVVTELYSFTTFLMIVFTYGMETAYFRYVNNEEIGKKAYSTAFTGLLLSSIGLSLSLIILTPTLAQALHYEQHPEYLICFALLLGLDAVAALPFCRLRQEQKPLRFAGLKLLGIILNIGLNLFFFLLCPWMLAKGIHIPSWVYRPDIGVGYIFLSNLLANGITLLFLLPLFPKLSLDKPVWKAMFSYGWPLMIAGLAGMMNETLDRIVLKYFLPGTNQLDKLRQVGIYGAVYKLAMLMTLFTQTFRFAAEPFFFQHSKNKDAKELYAKVMRYFALAAIVLYFIIIVYLEFIKYFLDERYHEGLFIVPWLLAANLCLGLYQNLSIWFKISGQTKYGLYFTFFGATVTLVGNIVAIPLFGYAGAAYTTFVCYLLMLITCYVVGQKKYPVPYPVGKIVFWFALALGLSWAQERFLFEIIATDLSWRLGVKIAFTVLFVLILARSERKALRTTS